MKALIQRVSSASVTINGKTKSTIGRGILLLLGIEKDDAMQDIEKIARKVHNYRIFSDSDGKMNLSLLDLDAELLVVSQFTLVADTKKGNRPGFSGGATPEHGEHIYQEFIEHVNTHYKKCESGEFGADMQVSLVNDGPVTFLLS
ncbi:D-tyrosyl-tRNA(Tyr) deacylase [Glaciecola sp. MH2013]|uniref:D-aminoacyl-tRNA deacylase n=1 Tax=Glaciecola sp. MH2013 TaxID=2785524 RepID=UPI00189E9432|nr:D-aminoacyl-tRNA deacylase [Glaciecola sp. MH2013]MBF7073844.1 D-tyrosyl-tRNA(Tyr) deacylase [Glaciecola sp. MH2013]